jgi:hypothetical protein
MSQKNSPTANEGEPGIQDHMQDKVSHLPEQLPLPNVAPAPLAVSWPAHGTAPALLLDLMLTGKRVCAFDMPPELIRMSSYAASLRADGWPWHSVRDKHPSKKSRVGYYWLDAATIERVKPLRPLDLPVTTAADLTETKGRAPVAQPVAKSVTNSDKVNSDKPLSDMKQDGAIDAAVTFLKNLLTGKGYVPTATVNGMAAEQGINGRTLERARKLLGTQTAKVGAVWFLQLPDTEAAP